MLKSKKILALLLVLSIVSLFSVSAFAKPGGMPAAHGSMTGREFGEAVSALAKTAPGAVAAHIAEKQPDLEDEELEDEELEEVEIEIVEVEIEEEDEGDMPIGKPVRTDGMTGRAFGAAVSEWARSKSGAMATRVRMPA